MPSFKLNGREVDFAPGELLIHAAARHGVSIPYYCYHPDLPSPANCRMCLVENAGEPKLVPSCQRPCNDKMDVQTETARVKQAQRDVMEFLLVNHPLDCPICDQAGECKLQQYAYLFGPPASSMEEPKVKLEKRKVLGPHVVLDQERCISCTRCVRFVHEITRTHELDMVRRSSFITVDRHPDRELANAYSGCVVDMCPVGALTDRQFRFQARVWYLRPTPSTCTLCSRGCNVSVDTRGERLRLPDVKRIRARRNPAVNASWMCDEGRYGHLRPDEGRRPLRAAGGTPRSAEPFAQLDAAWEAAGALLRSFAGQQGWLGVLASGAETVEELASLAELASAADPRALLVVPAWPDEPEDEILRRTDKTANQRGARRLGWGDDLEGLRARAVLLVADADLRPDAGLPGDGVRKVAGRSRVVALAAHQRSWADLAEVFLPLANAFEKDGVVVNFAGVAQRLARAVPPPGDCRTASIHASRVAAAAGLGALETDPAALLARLAAGALAPLDPARLGAWGARLPDAPGAAVDYVEEPPHFPAAPRMLAEGEYLPFVPGRPPQAIHVGAGQPPPRRAADSEAGAP